VIADNNTETEKPNDISKLTEAVEKSLEQSRGEADQEQSRVDEDKEHCRVVKDLSLLGGEDDGMNNAVFALASQENDTNENETKPVENNSTVGVEMNDHENVGDQNYAQGGNDEDGGNTEDRNDADYSPQQRSRRTTRHGYTKQQLKEELREKKVGSLRYSCLYI